MAKIFSSLSRKKLEEMCEDLRVLAAERGRKIEAQRNHITFLSENAQKWSKKFSDPRYRIPEQIIREMEEETEEYKERTEAELVRLRNQKAELVTRLVKLQSDAEDNFGSAEGNKEASFDFAESHAASVISDADRRVVDAEISMALREQNKATLEKMRRLNAELNPSENIPEQNIKTD